jgi:hypothetical protein
VPLAAQHGSQMSIGSMVVVACVCAPVLGGGVLHYRGGGRRSWLYRLPFEANFFLPAWFGACGLLVVLDNLLGRVSGVAEAIVGVPTLISFAVMLMSLAWLPRRLLPAWYLAWRAHGRPRSELGS